MQSAPGHHFTSKCKTDGSRVQFMAGGGYVSIRQAAIWMCPHMMRRGINLEPFGIRKQITDKGDKCYNEFQQNHA